MKKWTVRVPDALADDFVSFCAREGLTVQGTLEALIKRTVQGADEGSIGPTFVEEVRVIDAERRGRGR